MISDVEGISTIGKISLNEYKGKWIVLFSYPEDFEGVSTTEIISFEKTNTYFKRLNTNLIGLGIDSNASHLAWLYDIYQKTGVTVSFPIISDLGGTIARKYGMISNDINVNKPVRNTFIIDDKGIVRAILTYPMNIGRCIPEILRILEALQITDEYNAYTPINWVEGEPLIKNNTKTYNEMMDKIKEIEEKRNGLNWYLSFENINNEIKKENNN